uniref:Uncharacterized protein n=1 Tax=Octopus bimaculoides TaxID=37653 RepID=A0A0L8HQR7_OCTBM
MMVSTSIYYFAVYKSINANVYELKILLSLYIFFTCFLMQEKKNNHNKWYSAARELGSLSIYIYFWFFD